MEDKINSSKAPEPVGLYPHARKVGNLLFLSGVGPRERGTKIIPGVELDENGEPIDLSPALPFIREGVKAPLPCKRGDGRPARGGGK